MDYHVYLESSPLAVKWCNTEKEAREYVETARQNWRTSGAPRTPAYRIVWNRDGRVIADFPRMDN